jgi:hypothetical protein
MTAVSHIYYEYEKADKKFCEELITYFPLIQQGLHNDASSNSSLLLESAHCGVA